MISYLDKQERQYLRERRQDYMAMARINRCFGRKDEMKLNVACAKATSEQLRDYWSNHG
jgi:hypothetical protein